MPSRPLDASNLVPNLPGYRPTKPKSNYHKSQYLGFKDGVRVVVGSDQTEHQAKPVELTPSEVFDSFLKDGEALRFYGFYLDSNNDIQHVVLHVYHDNTVHVYEKATENAGHFQGTIVKRQNVKTPTGQILTWRDFNVAQEVLIFARKYYICACDAFTRKSLEAHGKHVSADQPIPEQKKPEKKQNKVPSLAQPAVVINKSTKNFLARDGQVLRFYCIWNDDSTHGQLHKLVLHYFLADESMELREYQSNMHNTVQFIRRQKIPKKLPDLTLTGTRDESAFTHHDMAIGATLKVFERNIYLCGCDEFTRKFYREEGQELNEDIPLGCVVGFDSKNQKPILAALVDLENKQKEVPPVPSILPSGSKPTIRRFGFKETDTLNVVAKLETTDSLDSQREFVIRFHLIDDTIAIFERGVLNSGIKAGKFLERRVVEKPTGGHIEKGDIFIGSKLPIYGRTFIVVDMDEFSRKLLK